MGQAKREFVNYLCDLGLDYYVLISKSTGSQVFLGTYQECLDYRETLFLPENFEIKGTGI